MDPPGQKYCTMLYFLCCRGGTLIGGREYRKPVPGLLQTLPMSFSLIDPSLYLVLLCYYVLVINMSQGANYMLSL